MLVNVTTNVNMIQDALKSLEKKEKEIFDAEDVKYYEELSFEGQDKISVVYAHRAELKNVVFTLERSIAIGMRYVIDNNLEYEKHESDLAKQVFSEDDFKIR
jgi:hypothetical protein